MAVVDVYFDADAGIVRCRLEGFFTQADMDKYERDLLATTADARKAMPRLRMLFDSSAGTVQTPEIVDRMRAVGLAIRKPGDKLAVVVASSLMKMQANRSLQSEAEAAFYSVADAEAWLRG